MNAKVRLVAQHALNYSSTKTGANIRADLGQDVLEAKVRFPEGTDAKGDVVFVEKVLDKCPDNIKIDLIEHLRNHGHVRDEVSFEAPAAVEKK